MILGINCALYLITFLFLYKKRGVDLYSFLFLEFAGIAFLGYFSFYTGIYGKIFGEKNDDFLSIFPYILCFITFAIAFHPFARNKLNVNIKIPHRKYTNMVVYAWVIIMLAYTALKGSEAVITILSGLADAYESRHIDGEKLFVYDNFILHRLDNVGALFLDATVPFIIFYCVNCWYNKKQYFISILAMVLCFLPNIFMGISVGSRGILFGVFCKMLFFVLILKNYVSSKIRKVILVVFASMIATIAFYSWAITQDRVQDSRQQGNSIVRYFGEAFPNLGFNFYDKVEIHPYGARLFPEFLDYENHQFASTDDSYAYWRQVTQVPVLNFKTWFGDLYIEFGTIGAIIFTLLLSSLVVVLTFPRLTVYNISFLYYYFGMMTVSFAGVTKVSGFNLVILANMIVINVAIKKIYYNKSPLKIS